MAVPNITPEQIDSLVQKSAEAKEKAYCPYSKFPVGAALLGTDGKIYTGCNVENVAYGGTICAERTAICKAISEGCRKFLGIAVASNLKEEFITPCGPCRQFLVEFGMDIQVIMTKPDKTYKIMTSSQLLPDGFHPAHLDRERV